MKTYIHTKQAVFAKYIAPTNLKGSRIKVWSCAKAKIYLWNYAKNIDENFIDALEKYIKDKKWTGKYFIGVCQNTYCLTFNHIEKY